MVLQVYWHAAVSGVAAGAPRCEALPFDDSSQQTIYLPLQVYWPGMLLSAGLALPRRVFGHGFLTSGGLKMGKSMGNVVDPKVAVRNEQALVTIPL